MLMITHTHSKLHRSPRRPHEARCSKYLRNPWGCPLRQLQGDKNYITARHSSCLHCVIIPFVQQNLALTDDTPADSTLTKSCKPLDVQTSPVFYLAKSWHILANSKLFGDNHII